MTDDQALALVAEVERLRAHRELCTENLLRGYETGKAEERAAIVTMLRHEAECCCGTYTEAAFRVAARLDDAADAIERGEHRKETP